MIRLSCFSFLLLLSGCMATAEPPPPSGPPAPPVGIQIVQATYGGNCKAPPGNATAHLQQSCGGKQLCAYRVDHKVIGDPVVGCNKDYVAEWRCGTSDAVYRASLANDAPLGSSIELRCD